MGETGYKLAFFNFSEFEFNLLCEAGVSQILNRGTDAEWTELPAESYIPSPHLILDT